MTAREWQRGDRAYVEVEVLAQYGKGAVAVDLDTDSDGTVVVLKSDLLPVPAAGEACAATEERADLQRLGRALFAVDSKHHFHEGGDGLPTCACGFVGNARKRTQTEHITAAVLEEYDHD